MKRLLLVDGSNIIMRAAFGGQIAPAESVKTATGLIRRAARQAGASHLIVAIDSSLPSWRKKEYPEYKAHRSLDTEPWLRAAHAHWLRQGWMVEECAGFEADDVMATLAKRAAPVTKVTVVSGDSDLLPLTGMGVDILRPVNGGVFEAMSPAEVCAKYDVQAPELLVDLKAMSGESGDNIPGVPGIGAVRAAKLLAAYGNLGMVIAAGTTAKCRYSSIVSQHSAQAEFWFRLLSLKFDAPILGSGLL